MGLDGEIKNQLNSINQIVKMVSDTKKWHAAIGHSGGRTFTVETDKGDSKSFKFKELTLYVLKQVKEHKSEATKQDIDDIINGLKKIDEIGEKELKKPKITKYQKVMTDIKRAFGNIRFSRKRMYGKLEKISQDSTPLSKTGTPVNKPLSKASSQSIKATEPPKKAKSEEIDHDLLLLPRVYPKDSGALDNATQDAKPLELNFREEHWGAHLKDSHINQVKAAVAGTSNQDLKAYITRVSQASFKFGNKKFDVMKIIPHVFRSDESSLRKVAHYFGEAELGLASAGRPLPLSLNKQGLIKLEQDIHMLLGDNKGKQQPVKPKDPVIASQPKPPQAPKMVFKPTWYSEPNYLDMGDLEDKYKKMNAEQLKAFIQEEAGKTFKFEGKPLDPLPFIPQEELKATEMKNLKKVAGYFAEADVVILRDKHMPPWELKDGEYRDLRSDIVALCRG